MRRRGRVPFFGTKAETLRSLAPVATWFHIPTSLSFLASDWKRNPHTIYKKVFSTFPPRTTLIVRSSAAEEDLDTSSMAGRYNSYLNISRDSQDLRTAINNIVAEYDQNPLNQILIQKMVKNISCSGVTMTRNIDDGAPYFVINYDDESGQTDTITGGIGVHKTVYIYCKTPLKTVKSLRVRQCLRLARTLSSHYNDTPLDIEFAIGKDLSTHLLQVRRIANSKKWQGDVGDKVGKTLNKARRFLRATFDPNTDLLGYTTVLANMSDWNPAEMIGRRPRPLATSLYQDLITNRVWHDARAKLGYRKIKNTPLMHVVESHPFIDVRASLNSFLPKRLDKHTSTCLVNAALERLSVRPALHDKLEFELTFTVLSFDFRQEFLLRYPGLLSTDQLASFKSHLGKLTLELLQSNHTGTLHWAEQKLRKLHREQLKQYDRNSSLGHSTISVPLLLKECRTGGTFPFAIMARHAFIAETLLNSAIRRGAISLERVAWFKRSIQTVAIECDRLLRAAQRGEQDSKNFIRLFGHLRPGSYDIRSPRYSDRPKLLGFEPDSVVPAPETFEATNEEKQSLTALFKENSLGRVSSSRFFEYCKRAIAGREFGKFVFTRHLSDILEAIARLGEQANMDRNALSYLRIEQLSSCQDNDTNLIDPIKLNDQVTREREEWESQANIKLGYIIRSLDELSIIPLHRAAANFVTELAVVAPIVNLNTGSSPSATLYNKIVCIENADPGFDWIFSCGIAGLITQYGGINSHMAIRCSEFSIPAAIGCGEQTFEKLKTSAVAQLDCENQIVGPVNATEH